jgi:metallo-beta-lactamase family protein
MELSFLGAAGEVTGSCFLLRTESVRFLVDCGLFQGGREAAGKNKRALVSDVAQLDFVLLTHAHIDHSGLIPRLWSLGFRGPIYATQATIELLSVLLPDSAYLAEATVARRTRRGGRAVADQDSTPLYTVAEAAEPAAAGMRRDFRGISGARNARPAHRRWRSQRDDPR